MNLAIDTRPRSRSSLLLRAVGLSVLARLLWGYRTFLSPLLGPSCRFEPSCSHYAEEAIATHGFLQGTGLALLRICRCHPFAASGLDPVPAPSRRRR